MKNLKYSLLFFLGVLAHKNYGESQDRVISMGVGPRPSKFTSNVNNTVFIDSSPVKNSGILFGVSVFLVSNMPFHIQVWRNTNGRQYTLIFDYVYQFSEATPLRQNILLSACVPLNVGDLVGVFFENSPWPIPFDYDIKHLLTLQTFFSSPPLLNSVHTIDTLHFPYVFSLSSWILNDAVNNVSDWRGACPTDVIIPEQLIPISISTTPAPPPTGPIGATGNTGPQGPVGYTGHMGSTGKKGAIGLMGSTGSRGPLGLIGSTGSRGSKGFTGRVGSEGEQGYTGAQGITGHAGEPGPIGLPGPDAVLSYTVTPRADSVKNYIVNNWWWSESLIIGVYIWLAILSFLLLLCLVWAAVLCSKFKKLRNKGMASSKDNLLQD